MGLWQQSLLSVALRVIIPSEILHSTGTFACSAIPAMAFCISVFTNVIITF